MAVTIYTRQYCFYCVRAKSLLDELKVSYREIPVDGDPDTFALMRRKSGRNTVPQIWIGDTHVGGCDDLYSLHRSGKLRTLLDESI